jgi:hypothetical protein
VQRGCLQMMLSSVHRGDRYGAERREDPDKLECDVDLVNTGKAGVRGTRHYTGDGRSHVGSIWLCWTA